LISVLAVCIDDDDDDKLIYNVQSIKKNLKLKTQKLIWLHIIVRCCLYAGWLYIIVHCRMYTDVCIHRCWMSAEKPGWVWGQKLYLVSCCYFSVLTKINSLLRPM